MNNGILYSKDWVACRLEENHYEGELDYVYYSVLLEEVIADEEVK